MEGMDLEHRSAGRWRTSTDEPSGTSPHDEVVGPFYTVASLAEVLEKSPSVIYRRITAGTVLAGRLARGRLVCPIWQVDNGEVAAEFVGIWQNLRSVADDWTVLL